MPQTLPALMYARKLQRKAAGGSDRVDPASVLADLRSRLDDAEQAIGEEGAGAQAQEETRHGSQRLYAQVGDLLFAIVELSRSLQVDPELALKLASERFRSAKETLVSAIERVHARQILDSRGNPTVEVDVRLTSGAHGRAAVPSGASTGALRGARAARRRRCLGRQGRREGGRGNVNGEIARRSSASTHGDQAALDRALLELDGTPNKARSAPTRSWACRWRRPRRPRPRPGLPLYRHLGGDGAHVLPVPMMNVLNGGAHADNRLDFQEFMVVPRRARHVSPRDCAGASRCSTR